LRFLGGENISYKHLTCTVMVEPNSTYIIGGRSKGRKITTLSGPFVDVIYPGSDVVLARSKTMIDSWNWEDFQLDIEVPEGVHFLKIRMRRNTNQFLDSKISGDVWFKDVYLKKQVLLDSSQNSEFL